MNEKLIEEIAWQLGQSAKGTDRREVFDLEAFENYREGERTSGIEQRLANDDEERERWLKHAGVTETMPPASVRERLLASTSASAPTKSLRARSVVRWAAAVSVIGVGLAGFFITKAPPESVLSAVEFSTLQFQVTATGLQDFRGKPATETEIKLQRDTPLNVVVEASMTPTQPVRYAVFEQLGDGVREIQLVKVKHYPGAVEIVVPPDQLNFSPQTRQNLYVVVSRYLDIREQDVVASRDNSATNSNLRVFPVEVSFLDK